MPYLLPDVRTIPDHERILYFTEVQHVLANVNMISHDIERFSSIQGAMNTKSIIRERNQMEPYLLSNGTVNDYNQLFLIVDCKVLGEVSIQTVPVILLAVYFVYNICYHEVVFVF